MNWQQRPRCDRTRAWSRLRTHFTQASLFDLRAAFASDAGRAQRFSQSAPYLFADLSKNLIDQTTQDLLFELATECGVEAYRDAMFAGDKVNASEQRAVLHTLLREPPSTPGGSLATERKQVRDVLDAMLAYAETVRADTSITDVVNIGIGGSDLGPHMAVLALEDYVLAGKRFHFVSNVDGHEMASTLKGLKPESTLFLIASKSFTTAETMTNATSAKRWFEAHGGTDTARHFAALTTNVEAAKAFGISTTFGFWDWVGGRYSLWSAIGLPVAIAIGAEGFRAMLAGAHEMDLHFRTQPMAQNLPLRMGLLDVWYRNFHGFASRNVAPYHFALRRLPAYLQQLEMESNGKRVDQRGQALPFDSAPVIWGEPGTNGQHAFFQMLHQGTDVIPVEFIVAHRPTHALAGHHEKLLANAVAQAQALMLGKGDPEGHRHFPGNRPSSFVVMEQLTPESLGALIALHEHRVFVSGAVWGIDSFDQWGVELGKTLALDIEPRLESGLADGLDGSTAQLLRQLGQWPDAPSAAEVDS